MQSEACSYYHDVGLHEGLLLFYQKQSQACLLTALRFSFAPSHLPLKAVAEACSMRSLPLLVPHTGCLSPPPAAWKGFSPFEKRAVCSHIAMAFGFRAGPSLQGQGQTKAEPRLPACCRCPRNDVTDWPCSGEWQQVHGLVTWKVRCTEHLPDVHWHFRGGKKTQTSGRISGIQLRVMLNLVPPRKYKNSGDK